MGSYGEHAKGTGPFIEKIRQINEDYNKRLLFADVKKHAALWFWFIDDGSSLEF